MYNGTMRYFNKRNRAILREMVSTDFKVRYQGSVLGYAWSLFRPLLLFAILYVVFVYIFNLGKGIAHYPVYLLFGIVIWNFFVETTSVGMGSVVTKGELIRKISIPRYLVVLSSSASALINLSLNLLVVLVFAVINGVYPMITWLWLPAIILEMLLFASAVAFFLSAMYVKFRDLSYIWEVVLQAGFYGTPILYSLTKVPEKFRVFLLISPVAQMIQDGRYFVITKTSITGWNSLRLRYAILPLVVVVICCITSALYFKKESKYFAENI